MGMGKGMGGNIWRVKKIRILDEGMLYICENVNDTPLLLGKTNR